ncbi:MAG TPA: FIST N-terminal domain-containing protein [Polyangia bacterium]|nr:FIST N-terminal domain-containing protein [Polyangia bacterium]
MLSAGAGLAIAKDGATAGHEAARRALVAARVTTADLAIVFAGSHHEADEYGAVLGAVQRAIPRASIMGCSATGVLSAGEELENGNAVAVLVLGEEAVDGQASRLPRPILVGGVRGDARAAGARLGREVKRLAGGDESGVAVAVLIDPEQLDAVDFVSGVAETAPGAQLTGAGASGGTSGCRIFYEGAARTDACVALVLPRELRPTVGMTQGCQALSDPLTITAADGNLILEIEGRPPLEALDRTMSNPSWPGLRKMTPHLLAGIGERGADGRSDYFVRHFAIAEGDRPALAVAEPVRAGQTIRFTVRDAIGARDDMKAMLEEQADARTDHPARFGVYFNCAGRGSALYGQPGLDPVLIQRRFGDLPVVGIESSFEIGPACGRPRIHMFTGVLLLAG